MADLTCRRCYKEMGRRTKKTRADAAARWRMVFGDVAVKTLWNVRHEEDRFTKSSML